MPLFRAEDLSAWCGGTWTVVPAEPIRGVSTDTRSLQPGQLYVALRGPRFDGHAFVEEAFRRGATAALVGPSFDRTSLPKPLLYVPDPLQALAHLAAGYRSRLGACCIGITGSFGKTTVKEMAADVLAGAGPVARSRGNWNNDIGLPLSLLEVEPETRHAVFEVAMNHPGEIARLSRILQPQWGVVTGIGPVHLEFFESVEAIAREKAALLSQVPPDGCAFLNCDDPWFGLLRAAASCPVVTLSLKSEADYRAHPDPAGGGRFVVEERATGERAALIVPLPGRHMMANALFAVALGRHAGLAWEGLRRVLERYVPLPLRWTRVEIGGFRIVNDAYNANPVSMRAALDAFAEEEPTGRRWLVLGGMHELGASEKDLHMELGRDLAKGPWAGLLAVGPRGAWIADGAEAVAGGALTVIRCADAGEAARILRERAAPGDRVLLKASRAERLEQVLDALSS